MSHITTEEAVAKADAAYAALDYHALHRETWRTEVAFIEEQLANDLASANPTLVPNRIWRKAWDDSHSEGYYSVASTYEDLAELVQVAQLAAVQEAGA